MRIRFTSRALADLLAITDDASTVERGTGRRIREAIDARLRQVVEFPFSGREQTAPGVRKVVTRRYPYLIYCQVAEAATEVVVLGIKHGALERSFQDQ